MLSGYHSINQNILRTLPKKYRLKIRRPETRNDSIELETKSKVKTQITQQTRNDTAELSNLISELTVIKERLQTTLQDCNKQLSLLQNLNQEPMYLQQQIDQLQSDSNFMFGTVVADTLAYYISPTTDYAPFGHYQQGERILILYNLIENAHGLWLQTRNSDEPESRYWILVSTNNNDSLNVDHFSVLP